MSSSLLVFIALAFAALIFILWPFIRRGAFSPVSGKNNDDYLQTNIQLFREHMAELEAALADNRIDAEQFAQLKLEQERKLLDDEATVAAGKTAQHPHAGMYILALTGLLTVGLAVGLYQRWGSAEDVAIQHLQERKNQLDYEDLLANREPDEQRARELVAALEERLARQPDNSQYWFMLARNAMAANDFSRAINAYRKVLSLDPETGLVMGELAQALFLRDQNRMSPEIEALAKSAVERDPNNTTALGLLGIAAFERKAFTAAADYWQRAVKVMGSDAPGSRALASGIARAQAEAAKSGTAADSDRPVARRLEVLVERSSELAHLPADAIVFVYARAWQGARMPLAIQRVTLGDLPQLVTLDESTAMSPEMSLAQAEQVEVVARVALDGSAVPKAGDWQGVLGPLKLDDLPAELSVIIDQEISE